MANSLFLPGRFCRVAVLSGVFLLAGGGRVQAQAPGHTWTWATPMKHPVLNGSFSQLVYPMVASTVMDPAGNQYVTGAFLGTVAFGATVLTSHQLVATDMFVAKLSPSGQWLWATNAGSSTVTHPYNGGTHGDAIAIDGLGNVCVAGTFTGSVAFGSNQLTCFNPGLFVVRLTPGGQLLGAVAAIENGGTSGPSGGRGLQARPALAADRAGNLYVSGTYGAIMRFGTRDLPDRVGFSVFVARLSSANQWDWLRVNGYQSPGPGARSDAAVAHQLVLGPGGLLALSGRFATDTIRFGAHVSSSGDVFVARIDTAGTWQGVVAARAGAGSWLTQGLNGLAVDSAGHAYISGTSYGTPAIFGGDTLTAPLTGGSGAVPYVAAADPAGGWRWARQGSYGALATGPRALYSITESGITQLDFTGQPLGIVATLPARLLGEPGWTLTMGAQGQVAVAGVFRGAGLVGSTRLNAADVLGGVFVAQLVPGSGTWHNVAQSDAGGFVAPGDIVSDEQGNTYVTGALAGSVTIGSTVLTSAGELDIFVAKLDRSGQPIWAVQGGGAGWQRGQAVAVDRWGNVFVAGVFDDSLVVGSSSVAGTNPWHTGFVAKLSPQGRWRWGVVAPVLSGTDDFGMETVGRRLAADGAGNVWLGDSFADTLQVGPTQLVSHGAYDGYVARLDSAGQWHDAVAVGGVNDDEVRGVSADGHRNAYVTGYFSRTMQLGGITLTNSDSVANGFVGRLQPGGTWRWARQVTGGSNLGSAVAADARGAYVLMAGSYEGQITPGGLAPLEYGWLRSYVARLDSSGQWQWASALAGTGGSGITALSVDGAGNGFAYGLVLGGSVRFGADSVYDQRVRVPGPAQAGFHQGRGMGVQGGPPIPAPTPFLGVISAAGQWSWGTGEVGRTVTASGRGDVFTTGMGDSFGPLTLPPSIQGSGFVAGMLDPLLGLRQDGKTMGRLAAWPNPARDAVRLTGFGAGAGIVQLLDVLGREVRSVAVPAGAREVVVRLAGLQPGIYLVRAGSGTLRLMKTGE